MRHAAYEGDNNEPTIFLEVMYPVTIEGTLYDHFRLARIEDDPLNYRVQARTGDGIFDWREVDEGCACVMDGETITVFELARRLKRLHEQQESAEQRLARGDSL